MALLRNGLHHGRVTPVERALSNQQSGTIQYRRQHLGLPMHENTAISQMLKYERLASNNRFNLTNSTTSGRR
jgi:hypothetical protein